MWKNSKGTLRLPELFVNVLLKFGIWSRSCVGKNIYIHDKHFDYSFLLNTVIPLKVVGQCLIIQWTFFLTSQNAKSLWVLQALPN